MDCFVALLLAMTAVAQAVTTPPLLRRPTYCNSANTPVAIACATVHDTGVFVFVQVQTIENRVGKALCPMWLVRQLRSLLRR
jgi:hypothetical protein